MYSECGPLAFRMQTFLRSECGPLCIRNHDRQLNADPSAFRMRTRLHSECRPLCVPNADPHCVPNADPLHSKNTMCYYGFAGWRTESASQQYIITVKTINRKKVIVNLRTNMLFIECYQYTGYLSLGLDEKLIF